MKKNLPLIIGLALPVLFIIIISAIVFTPNVFIKPAHDFIYSNETNYYNPYQYQLTYVVENEKITTSKIPVNTDFKEPTNRQVSPTLYIYNVKDDSTHQITLEEAQKYTLDPGPTSADGYVVAYNYGHYGLFELFGSNGNNNAWYVTKGTGKKRLNGLTTDRYYGSGNFKFIGWIK